ncbi:MAG: hypothetical protein ACTSRA_06220 [Promethearchaeota archaeon]
MELDLKLKYLEMLISKLKDPTEFEVNRFIECYGNEYPFVRFRFNQWSIYPNQSDMSEDERMVNELFRAMITGETYFIKHVEKYNDQVKLARHFLNLLRVKLRGNEVLFRDRLTFLDPVKYCVFWKQIIKYRFLKEILAELIGFSLKSMHDAIIRAYGEPLTMELLSIFKEMYGPSSISGIEFISYGTIDGNGGNYPRGKRIGDNYYLWGDFIKQPEKCPRRDCGRTLSSIRIDGYNDEYFLVCPVHLCVVMDENQYLRVFKNFKIS